MTNATNAAFEQVRNAEGNLGLSKDLYALVALHERPAEAFVVGSCFTHAGQELIIPGTENIEGSCAGAVTKYCAGEIELLSKALGIENPLTEVEEPDD